MKSLRTIWLLGLLPAMAAAQETATADTPEDRTWQDEVTVTATRHERRLEEVPVHVTVVDAGDLEQTAAVTLDDALRRVPGFNLFRRAGSRTAHPTTQGVSLRGIGPSGASRTLVVLDGVPVNDPFGDWIYWSRLPRESLERIELARGASSDLWGSAALGGVVQLLTGEPAAGGSVKLGAELGSHDERRLGVAAGTSGEGVSVFVDTRYFESARYSVIREDQSGAIDIPAFSEHGAFYGKLRAALSERAGFELRLNYSDEERGNGTPLTGNDTRGGYLAAGFDRTGADGSSWRLTLTAYDQTFENRFSAQAADRGSERPALDQFDIGSDTLRADLEWTRPVGARHRLTGGLAASHIEASTSENFFFVGTVEDGVFIRLREAGGERRLAGLFLQDEIRLGDRLAVTISGRLDRWQARSGFRRETNLETGQFLIDNVFADRDATEISPRVGFSFQADSAVTVHGAAYRAFRAPTINELYRPFRVRSDITAANPELVPETILGVETGVSFRGSRVRAGVTAFWNRLDDPVTNLTLALGPGVIPPCGFVPGGGLCRQRRNLEEVRVLGLEADMDYRPTDAWRISWSYLWSDAEVRRSSVVPELAGRRLPQVPENQWVVAVEHTDPGRLGGRLQLRYVDDQFEDDLNTRPLAGVLVVDLTLRRSLGRGLELFVAAENLFDRTVESGKTADGLVSVGAPRLVHGGVRWRWR